MCDKAMVVGLGYTLLLFFSFPENNQEGETLKVCLKSTSTKHTLFKIRIPYNSSEKFRVNPALADVRAGDQRDVAGNIWARVTRGIIWASSRENLSSGSLTKPVSNKSPQLQRLASKLKFHL